MFINSVCIRGVFTATTFAFESSVIEYSVIASMHLGHSQMTLNSDITGSCFMRFTLSLV